MDDQGRVTAAELQAIRAELAEMTVSLQALSTTLDTLARGLARHPPGDLSPILNEVRLLREQMPRHQRWPLAAKVVVVALALWTMQDFLGNWLGFSQAPDRPRPVQTSTPGKGKGR